VLAQEDTVAGHWRGEIDVPGNALGVDVDLALSDGAWSGDISIPVQQMRDYALADVTVEGDSVSFRIPGVPGDPTFAGTRDGETITGDFTQGGQTIPFTLTRGEDRAAIARAALDGIDPIIEKALEDFGVPGLAVAVVANDQLVFAKGYGSRDVANGLPVTDQTLFAIGSTSKAFTAFIIGMLVDEGTLAWDTPLIEYMPDFRMYDEYATQNLTVRDLLIHSSGLPRHDLAWYGADASRQEIFERLAHLEPTHELREEWQYQNIMFMTAGLLAERVTGQTWEELVRARIFDPLEMSRTNFSVEASKLDPDHALPYNLDEGKAELVPFRNIDAVGPAGSINSSVAEMSQWMRLQLGGGELAGQRLIEEATLRQMHTPQMVVGGYPSSQRVMSLGYGMAWALESHRGHFLVQHGGGIDGFISWVALLPMEDFGVVVYTNAAGLNPVPTAVARTIIDRVLGLDDGGYLENARTAITEAAEAAAALEADANAGRVADTVPSHDLADFAGKYSHPGYGVFDVTFEDGGLRATYNGMSTSLAHWHYDTFVADEDGAQLDGTKAQFRMDGTGAINEVLVALEPTMSPRVLTRMAEDRLSDPQFVQRFVGDYMIAGRQKITIELRGATLFGTVTGQPTFELVPSTGTSFTLKEAEGITVEFLMAEDGSVPTIRLHQPNGVFDGQRAEEGEAS
jgi:CubicO group peptidase (beta-lactamase class C family)